MFPREILQVISNEDTKVFQLTNATRYAATISMYLCNVYCAHEKGDLYQKNPSASTRKKMSPQKIATSGPPENHHYPVSKITSIIVPDTEDNLELLPSFMYELVDRLLSSHRLHQSMHNSRRSKTCWFVDENTTPLDPKKNVHRKSPHQHPSAAHISPVPEITLRSTYSCLKVFAPTVLYVGEIEN
jgi:hypothetical protein